MSDAAPVMEEVRTPRGVVLRGNSKCGVFDARIGPFSISLFRFDRGGHEDRASITANVASHGILRYTAIANFGFHRMDEALAWIDNRIEDFEIESQMSQAEFAAARMATK